MPLNALPQTCPTCGHASFTGHHCPPKWRVWNPEVEEEEDARVIFAEDPMDAVEAWAEHDDNDSAEYDIAKGKPAVVSIRREPTDGAVFQFKVFGEYRPHYWSEPVE